MRIDKNNPNRVYKDFGDWLRRDGHFIFVLLGVVIGYLYYLSTTIEA
jgi:hypothetical protein